MDDCDESDDNGRPVTKADRELVGQILWLAIEAFRREEVSQGWLRDLSAKLDVPAEYLGRTRAEAAASD